MEKQTKSKWSKKFSSTFFIAFCGNDVFFKLTWLDKFIYMSLPYKKNSYVYYNKKFTGQSGITVI